MKAYVIQRDNGSGNALYWDGEKWAKLNGALLCPSREQADELWWDSGDYATERVIIVCVEIKIVE